MVCSLGLCRVSGKGNTQKNMNLGKQKTSYIVVRNGKAPPYQGDVNSRTQQGSCDTIGRRRLRGASREKRWNLKGRTLRDQTRKATHHGASLIRGCRKVAAQALEQNLVKKR